MLSSTHPTSGSNGRVKSLHENPSESKTPELELQDDDIHTQTKLSTNYEASDSKQEEEQEFSVQSVLSIRASQMKEAINKQETVKAVVLSPDGSASEISYSTNSSQARKIVSGRPSIIGQLEEIGVVMVRSLDQSECGPANKNVLPAPFCNESYNGNILLFAVDSKGFSKDFSLSDYEKYSKSKESETAKAQKEFDGKQISIKSALSSSFFYDLTKVYIRSEIDKKSKTAKLSMKESVNALVEEILSLDSSPMNDPDYVDNESEIESEEQEEYSEETSESGDWRAQLEDALDCVRERGRSDGQYLADRISATFYELNGVEPSLSELKSIFAGIEQDFANEAEEDIESEKNYDAQRLAEQLASGMSENPDPTELVEYSQRIVGMDLVSRAKAAYFSINGKQPTKKALRRSVHKLALKLAEEAMDSSENVQSDVYDPQNIDDQVLAKIDEIESEQFDADHYNLKMLTTESKSKKGKYEAYDILFSNFDQKTERKNLHKAIESFKMRNRRSPTSAEVEGIEAFLSTSKDTSLVQFKLSVISDEDDEQKEEKKNEKLLVTPVKKKKDAARFNVYFDDKEVNTETALKWFERFTNRKPTQLEMSGIESFIRTDKSELIECEFEVSAFDISKAESQLFDDDDSKYSDEERALKMKTSKAVKKKTSTTYTLDFADKSVRESGDVKQALKWFERFNSRQANKEERARISQFVKADNEQIINID